MFSIGNSALQQKFIDRMVSLLCEKNELLCDGKCVQKVNAKLRKLYNYWSLFTDCNLTDNEINCINTDIGVNSPVSFGTTLKKETPSITPVTPTPEPPKEEPVYDKLTCSTSMLSQTQSGGDCYNKVYNGSYSIQVLVTGGKTPYTYSWTAVTLVQPTHGCYEDTATILSTHGIASTTSDVLTATTAPVCFVEYTVTITDALGNTTECKQTVYQKSTVLYE